MRFFFPLPRGESNREGEDDGATLGKTWPFAGVEGKAAGLPFTCSRSWFGEWIGVFMMSAVTSGSATAVVPLSDLASAIETSPTSVWLACASSTGAIGETDNSVGPFNVSFVTGDTTVMAPDVAGVVVVSDMDCGNRKDREKLL